MSNSWPSENWMAVASRSMSARPLAIAPAVGSLSQPMPIRTRVSASPSPSATVHSCPWLSTVTGTNLPGTLRRLDELETLRSALDGQRASVLKKLAGLSEQDARRTTVPSGTNLAGLVQHLTYVESLWFEEIVAGGRAARGKRSMQVDPSLTISRLRSDYREACAASDAVIGSIGDPDALVARNGKRHDLRWAIVGV